MKRHSLTSIFACCLMAAISLASCSRIGEIPGEEPEIQVPAANEIDFSATLAPKGEEPQSKAITSGTEAGKEVLNVAWAENERIAIYYQKTDDSYATAMATVGTPNVDGSAPLTATLTDAKGGTAKFIYPYSLAKDGELNTGNSSDFQKQDGTLEFISQKLDAATATGTIAVNGATATVSGTVAMQNQVCICKFNFRELNSDITENYYDITIREWDGDQITHIYKNSNTASIAKASMNAVYMALLGAEGKRFTFSVNGQNKTSASAEFSMLKNSYSSTSSNVTLTAGKFYRNLPVSFALPYLSGNISSTIVIPDGSTLTLQGANISVGNGAGILCEGDATIILEGTNSVSTGGYGCAAIQAGPLGTTLTIQGTGSLITTSTSSHGTGIGCGLQNTCGNIHIKSGTITVSSNDGTGIGCGPASTCGDITISGGTVTAKGGAKAAAIGCGYGMVYDAHCGNITINGGTVVATGGDYAAAIGCGYHVETDKSICGNITINDNQGPVSVTAIKGKEASRPIGHSDEGSISICGTIRFGDHTVYNAGDNPEEYNIQGGPFNLQITTTVPDGANNNYGDYNDNTWILTTP